MPIHYGVRPLTLQRGMLTLVTVIRIGWFRIQRTTNPSFLAVANSNGVIEDTRTTTLGSEVGKVRTNQLTVLLVLRPLLSSLLHGVYVGSASRPVL